MQTPIILAKNSKRNLSLFYYSHLKPYLNTFKTELSDALRKLQKYIDINTAQCTKSFYQPFKRLLTIIMQKKIDCWQDNNKNNQFGQYLADDTKFKEILINVMDSAIKTTKLFLTRLQENMGQLQKIFLHDLTEPITLENCTNLENDRHRFGLQAWKLTFKDQKGTIKEIIYKPSPQECSALLIGAFEELEQFDEQFKGKKSLLEIINSGLKETARLKTVLILPCQDKDKQQDDVNSHYGFVEFITYDGMVNNEKNKRRYSKDCGRLLAIIRLAGIDDIHFENVIAYKKRPVLIDVDVCLQSRSFKDICSDIFRSDIGAFRGDSYIEENEWLLEDTRIVSRIVPKIGKNRIYNKGAEIGIQPDLDILMRGYRQVIEIIADKKNNLKKWSQEIAKINPIIRYLPLETSEFYGNRNFYLENGTFPYDENVTISNLKKEKNMSIYLGSSFDYLLTEFRHYSIPWFYTMVNEHRLFTGDNTTVRLPKAISNESDPDLSKSLNNCSDLVEEQSFFLSTALEQFKRRLEYLIDHQHEIDFETVRQWVASYLMSGRPSNPGQNEKTPETIQQNNKEKRCVIF